MNFKNHDSGEFNYKGLPPKKRKTPVVQIRRPNLGPSLMTVWNRPSLSREQRQKIYDFNKRNGWTYR